MEPSARQQKAKAASGEKSADGAKEGRGRKDQKGASDSFENHSISGMKFKSKN